MSFFKSFEFFLLFSRLEFSGSFFVAFFCFFPLLCLSFLSLTPHLFFLLLFDPHRK